MKHVSICLALALAAVPCAAFADDTAMMAPISTFVDSFNAGHADAAAATMTADVSIIDEVAPFHWTGFAPWMAALSKQSASDGRTGESVTLDEPTRIEMTGDSAYVIVPATYRFTLKGTAMEEVSEMTFALTMQGGSWKIAAWTWTGPAASPAE